MMSPAPVRRGAGLPAETTGFVGRKPELAMLGALLASSRLVTITGPGGVGKTRLALRAVRAAAPRYRQGAAFAELSALRDPELLPHTVAYALGLPSQQDGRPPLEAVTGYLRDRELLLVLDTCEHVIDAAALFAEAVLSDAPGVTILATSRQPLDVTGESICPLGPLRVPDDGDRDGAGDAVELFAQRAAAASPGFAVTDRNRAEVIRLCRRLDGIPLAIELAAVRLQVLNLSEVTLLVEHRLRLLAEAAGAEEAGTGDAGPGDRAAPPRHQAMRDAIGWSYDLCIPAEQALWARLSVFAGPFSVAAAEEVCADDPVPRGQVLPALIGLVDKSVVIKADDEGHYRMLDTIREYGAERLAQCPEQERTRRRLLARYLRLAEEFDADPLTGQLAKYRELRAEHASIRAAIGYGFALEGADRAVVRLLWSLYWYWEISALFDEARIWLAESLERFGGPSAERASALLMFGLIEATQGDPGSGLRDCEEGLALSRNLGEARIHARGKLYYSWVLMMAGKLPEATEAGQLSARLMRDAGDAVTADAVPLYLALIGLMTGDIEGTVATGLEGLRRLPDTEYWIRSFMQGLTGLALFLKGEAERGAAMVRESVARKRELGDPNGLAYGLSVLGFIAASQGRFRRAAYLSGAAAPLWELVGGAPFGGAPGLRVLTETAIAEARKALGENVYDELFEAAARQPLEESLEIAITDTDDLPALP